MGEKDPGQSAIYGNERPMSNTNFIEKPLLGQEPTRCVDGRPASFSKQGPQMPGGSLHISLIYAIDRSIDLDEEAIRANFSQLTSRRFLPGVHRGSHKHPEKNTSDCGAADKARLIFTVAVKNKGEIIERLTPLYQAYGNILGPVDMLETSYEKISAYDPERITITGEDLIRTAKHLGAIVEDVEGDHSEKIAFINLKRGVTFDTQKANETGWQAFNLDLQAVMDQSRELGIDPQFAAAASLVLYVATEMVLVEKYGVSPDHHPALPVKVHK